MFTTAPTPPDWPTQLLVFLQKFKPVRYSSECPYTFRSVAFHQSKVDLLGVTTLKKIDSLSFPEAINYQSLLREEWDIMLTYPFHDRIWSSTDLECAATTAVSSHVNMLCCIQKTPLPCSHLLSLDSILLSQRSLSLSRRSEIQIFHLRLILHQSHIVCT